MADVRWIKIYTDMISNKKIKRIRKLPEGNNIVLIWVFLLAQAGECNKSGALYLTDAIAFRPEDLAIEFDYDVTVINLALITLERFSMIEVFEEIIYIKNWDEYQNIEGMDKIREQTRLRNIKYREKRKQLLLSDVSVTSHDDTELDLELDLDKEINKKEYAQKVYLFDKEYQKLIERFGEDDTEYWIDKLSQYKVKKNKNYESDYMTVLSWDRKEKRSTTTNLKIAATDGDPKRNKAKAAVDREIAFNRWIDSGGNPDDFVFQPTA